MKRGFEQCYLMCFADGTGYCIRIFWLRYWILEPKLKLLVEKTGQMEAQVEMLNQVEEKKINFF